MKRTLQIVLIFLAGILPSAYAGIRIEKNKLKLSFEYENFVDPFGNEIVTPGLKASYWWKAGADFGPAYVKVDYQTGLKSLLARDFTTGELPAFLWSNRLSTSFTVPVRRFYFGVSGFLWNKWLDHSSTDPFIDVFGGLGFRELTGGVYAGFSPSQRWDFYAIAQKSDLNFTEFPLSNSNWTGESFRISRRVREFRINAEYRTRDIDYNRPVTPDLEPGPGPIIFPTRTRESFTRQQDHFREWGGSIEFFHGIYFLGGYYYQDNDSNNPNFDYQNHRVQFVVAGDISPTLHLQAFGSVQRFDFLRDGGPVEFPLLLEENEYNTMAASLIRTLGKSDEIEFGFQRLSNRSSLESLDVSKFIFFAAYNYRF